MLSKEQNIWNCQLAGREFLRLHVQVPHIRLWLSYTHCVYITNWHVHQSHWISQFAKHGASQDWTAVSCERTETADRNSCHTAKRSRAPLFVHDICSNLHWGRFQWDFQGFEKELVSCLWMWVFISVTRQTVPAHNKSSVCPQYLWNGFALDPKAMSYG